MSNTVLAIVAGKEITNGDIDKMIQRMPQQQAYAADPQFRAHILNQLIDKTLFEQKAIEDKLEATEEFQKVLADVKADLLSQLAMTNVVRAVELTEEDALAFYEANKAQFAQEESVSAKHILTKEEEGCVKAALEIANGDKTFEEAAVAYSTCPSGPRGGDLGTFGKGQMVKEFEDAAFNGELNQVIGPVKTQFGYHLIYVYDKAEAGVAPYEKVEAQVKQAAMNQKQQAAYTEMAEALGEKYGVEKVMK